MIGLEHGLRAARAFDAPLAALTDRGLSTMAEDHITRHLLARKRTLAERLRAAVNIAPNGCWEWQGGKSGWGYGRLYVRGRMQVAHRASFEEFVGPIPVGREVDHLCRNPCCINPAHLEAVTHKENVLRGNGTAAQNARKTHCAQGHELTEANIIRECGRRLCRQCTLARRRIANRRRYWAKKEAARAYASENGE